jgi:hypothetical protein
MSKGIRTITHTPTGNEKVGIGAVEEEAVVGRQDVVASGVQGLRVRVKTGKDRKLNELLRLQQLSHRIHRRKVLMRTRFGRRIRPPNRVHPMQPRFTRRVQYARTVVHEHAAL